MSTGNSIEQATELLTEVCASASKPFPDIRRENIIAASALIDDATLSEGITLEQAQACSRRIRSLIETTQGRRYSVILQVMNNRVWTHFLDATH